MEAPRRGTIFVPGWATDRKRRVRSNGCYYLDAPLTLRSAVR